MVATPVAHLVGPGTLKVINGRVAFATAEGVQLALDLRPLELVLCYGRVGVTDAAVHELLLNDVLVAFLSYRGVRLRGLLAPPVDGSVTIRLMQYRVLGRPEAKFVLAQDVVVRKIASQLEAARYFQRHGGVTGALVGELRRFRQAADRATSHGELLGIEGSAAAVWFRILGERLQRPWSFHGRNRRPPRDPVNALLSLGYTLLTSRLVARCRAAGLEVALGALHEPRPGRPALACDLIEPLRVRIVDRWVLRLCNTGIVAPGDFRRGPEGGVILSPAAFSRVLAQWEAAWSRDDHSRRVNNEIERFFQLLRHLDRRPPARSARGPDSQPAQS